MANDTTCLTTTCLITLETRQDIEDRGGFVYDVTNASGKVQQIYDLEKLSQWLSLHDTFPHAQVPTPLEICELRSLNRIYLNNKFVYVKDTNAPPNYYEQKFQPVSRLEDINVIDDSGNVLLDDLSKIFAIYFDPDNFKTCQFYYYGRSTRRFCTQPRGQGNSLYHKLRKIKIHKIYIEKVEDEDEEVICNFSVIKNTPGTLYCSYRSKDIAKMLANTQSIRDNHNFEFIYKCVHPSLLTNRFDEYQKLVYFNREGETVFDKQSTA